MMKKTKTEGKPFFDVWMYEVSDEIQDFANAFSDRYMLEEALLAMAGMSDNVKAQKVVESAIYLHAIFSIKQNLGWYTTQGVISAEAGLEVQNVFEQAVRDFLPHMNTCVEALGYIPHKHLVSPIARDYVAFNAQNDNENFEAAGEVFDFKKTGEPRERL